MNNKQERPICHRAEDLVSYLYGEASAIEQSDFAQHLEKCDSCRAEFGSFKQLHESIVLWRNEALNDVSYAPTPAFAVNTATTELPLRERRRSARLALREFFAISPFWLRAAMAFATLALVVLGTLALSRLLTPVPQPKNDQAKAAADFQNAVNAEVEKRMKAGQNNQADIAPKTPPAVAVVTPRPQATHRQLARGPRPQLTRQEREQLAADLRLVPGREDELPFVFSDEPDQ